MVICPWDDTDVYGYRNYFAICSRYIESQKGIRCGNRAFWLLARATSILGSTQHEKPNWDTPRVRGVVRTGYVDPSDEVRVTGWVLNEYQEQDSDKEGSDDDWSDDRIDSEDGGENSVKDGQAECGAEDEDGKMEREEDHGLSSGEGQDMGDDRANDASQDLQSAWDDSNFDDELNIILRESDEAGIKG